MADIIVFFLIIAIPFGFAGYALYAIIKGDIE